MLSSGMSAPLLRRASGSQRQAALAVVGTCVVLAMVGLVFVVGAQSKPSVLVQQQYVQAAMQQPVYYMPVQAAQPQLAAAPGSVAQPIVYYYVPAQPQLQVATGGQMLPGNASAGAGNSSSAGNDKKPDFVCTVANIKGLSGKVQTKWDKCKTNKNYEQPNKDAKRRLMEWVWEPAPGEAAAAPVGMPSHGPGSYEMVLKQRGLYSMLNATAGGNASAAGGDSDDGPSMSDCMEEALGDACDDIAGCDDAVCSHYYNEPEIEALCGMCGMGNAGKFGCFAKNAQVMVAGKGATPIGQIEVEDEVLSAEGNSRVFFVHDHKQVSKTLRIAYEQDSMELTPVHYLPVYTEECGERYCAAAKQVRAESVKVGDRVYVQSAMGFVAKEVTRVTKGESKVRYVITESGTIVVNGVVASVYSTGAGFFETLPFRLMDVLFKGSLQAAPVAAALRTILESPMLQGVEAAINALAPSPKAVPAMRAFGAAPLSA